jgi:rhamnosyl/mannosyltransferase
VASLGRVASQELAPSFPRALARLRPDLVHLHAPNPLGVLACRLAARDVPVIVTHHSDVVRQRFLRHLVVPSYRRLLARAVGITVLSSRYGESSPELAAVRDRLVAIPYGVDERRFASTAEVAAEARELRASLPGQGPVVAFVGRHVHYKGLEVLMAALAKLPAVRALIAGDGPMRSTYEVAARTHGVAERVRFLGQVDDAGKAAVLHAADAFVLPCLNRAEAFGEVQVEAQLCGLPVVASRVDSGVVDVTRDGETGLCVPPGDPAALAAALGRLLGDADLRRRLGEAGRARARLHYVEPVVAPRLRAFVRACAEAARRGGFVDEGSLAVPSPAPRGKG